jgi:SAM-dependent methyltransferase
VTTIQRWVRWGLDRDIPELVEPMDGGVWINLGPGDTKHIEGTVGVGKGALATVDWWAPEPLPFRDNSVGAVHAHQFMEHLDADTAIAVLREVERVLMPGAPMFMTTPYPNSGHFMQALDHKTMWTEETWNWLFSNDYYSDHEGQGWDLHVNACFILGVVDRNRDLFTQLVKGY